MAERRSAKDWSRLIRELKRSGEEPAAFAKARGIRPQTLQWWRWRLGAGTKTARPARPPRVQLVAVEAEEEAPVASGTPVWELVTPAGHALRVYDARGLGVLSEALSAVAGGRRR
jgi:hypothetical protein